jgi:hypothetical protein
MWSIISASVKVTTSTSQPRRPSSMTHHLQITATALPPHRRRYFDHRSTTSKKVKWAACTVRCRRFTTRTSGYGASAWHARATIRPVAADRRMIASENSRNAGSLGEKLADSGCPLVLLGAFSCTFDSPIVKSPRRTSCSLPDRRPKLSRYRRRRIRGHLSATRMRLQGPPRYPSTSRCRCGAPGNMRSSNTPHPCIRAI